jgi:hypothetical protein
LWIVGNAACSDIYYQWKVNSFDFDKDGFFSGAEITPAQTKAMEHLTNDVGRNFSFITGVIFAFIFSIIIYIMGRLVSKFKKT